MRAILGILCILALGSTPVLAHERQVETRLGEEGFVSPPANIEELGWLVGQWSGEGIEGAPAMESWLPPAGGTMVGTFVQTVQGEGGEGAIMFTEHLYLMEEAGTLVLRLKHFNADLTGWEEKDGMLTFRLVAIEPCAAYFHALTLRCADAERPGEGLVAAVRMQSGGELLFRFEPHKPEPTASHCLDAMTTVDMNECHAAVLERAEARMNDYLSAALAKVEGEDAQTLLLRSTQEGFLAYRGGECGGVHEQFAGGSIRTAMYLQCAIRLTDERTHTLWRNWLTYMDSTAPVLPEPQPTL